MLEAGAVQDDWVVAQDLIWKDAKFGTLTCPRGFLTDLASIPRAFRNIPFLDPAGLSRRPAAMHDWLYAWRGMGKDNADEFLHDALLAEGASPGVAQVFFLGVHEFGQAAWDADAGILKEYDFVIPGSYDAWIATQPKTTP